MDTCANIPKIYSCYQRIGFTEVESYTTPDSEELFNLSQKSFFVIFADRGMLISLILFRDF